MTVGGVVGVLRPSTIVATAAITTVGYLAGGAGGADGFGDLPLAVLVTTTAVAAANVHNDVVDVAVDRVNRPGRALPAGRLSTDVARSLAAGLALTTAAAALGLGPGLSLWALASLALGLAYSGRLRRRPVASHLTVAALFGNAVLFGAAAGGGLNVRAVVAATEVTWFILGREILKGVPDVVGDRAAGTRTVATECGAPVAVRLFVLCAVLAAATAAAAATLGRACLVHPVGVVGTVTVPAMLVGRALARDLRRERVIALIDGTRLIWVSGVVSLLPLLWC